jgi:ABC-type antimicrobial peptide transport system permease subunit
MVVLGAVTAEPAAAGVPDERLLHWTGQTQSFSEIAFAFRITPLIIAQGLVFALLMGAIGGLVPAFRAARMPISRALREV